MSNTEVIKHIIEWEDSSQHLDEIPQISDNGETLSPGDDNIIIEVISSESMSIGSLASNTNNSPSPDVKIEVVNSDMAELDDKVKSKSDPPVQETSSESSSEEEQDNSKKSRGRKPSIKAKRLKPKRKTVIKKNSNKTSADDKPKPVELPSVYSKNQIARHTKRINKLKELEQNDESDSDASNEDIDETSNRDLDINLRIFEGSAESVDNVVIGEIQCNIIDDNASTETANNSNKNGSNVFKLSVNTNFVDVCDDKPPENTIDNVSVVEFDADDPLQFSDNDSDLEILVSKPIVRKRAIQPAKKDKPTEKKQKLTMYDLIHDNVCLSSDAKTDESEGESNETKPKETKKSKTNSKKSKTKKEEPSEVMKQMTESKDEKNQNLPVPKLKVGADGEVVIDMDSLVIEQTGVSEARNALANSEVIEECGLSYTSYNKKNSFRKQWSPHETLKFYKVLSTVGTDFTLMATLFPGRTRKCMKRKFKKEEKTNSDLILKALSCKQNFNIELLEKELQLKDEKVNQFKENTKKQKLAQKKNEKIAKKKEKEKEKGKDLKNRIKRQSFFQKSVSHFQNS